MGSARDYGRRLGLEAPAWPGTSSALRASVRYEHRSQGGLERGFLSRSLVNQMPADTPLAQPAAPDELIERCLRGDQVAWEMIVRQHWRKVFNVAYKFVGKHDEAEDLTQDIFLKIFKSLHTFDRRANFQTWLISVSRNLCIDHYRSVRKERETINRDVDPGELSPRSHDVSAYAVLEQQDRVVLLRAAMQQLPDTLRTAVMLRDIRELTYQEIADQLHLPEGTVKSRINRGRTELARQIQMLRVEFERPRNPPAGWRGYDADHRAESHE